MIKTPSSTVIGGAFWTPGATILGSSSKNLTQLIKSLFSLGEQGFAYDPSDLSTLYQDATRAIPVTAAGQPVGLMLDKSGRNNHAYQTVSASRPILQRNATTGAYYLAFDGVDDFLQTNSIDFTATDEMSLFAGVRKLSDAASAIVAELSPSSATNNGSFHLAAPDSVSGNNYQFASRGTVRSIPATPPTYISPISNVVSVAGEIASNTAKIRVDGAQVAQSTATQGTGNYGNYPLYIGRRGGASLPLNGHIYSLIGIGRLTTDAETTALEKLIAKNTGVTLS